MNGITLLHEDTGQTQEQITQQLLHLRKNAYVENSQFVVTSVFKVRKEGKTYYASGVNVENADMIVGTCAEEAAMATIATTFGKNAKILEGWVMGAPKGAEESNIPCTPCGECRQRLAHFAGEEVPIYAVSLQQAILQTSTRGALLPNAFSYENLESPRKKEESATNASREIESLRRKTVRQGKELTQEEILEWAKSLEADNKSTDRHHVIILKLPENNYVAAVQIENAAYPASTNPMQSAACIATSAFGNQPVQAVWTFARSPEKDCILYLPKLSEIQILDQLHITKETPITIINSKGEYVTTNRDTIACIPRTLESPEATLEDIKPTRKRPRDKSDEELRKREKEPARKRLAQERRSSLERC